MIRLQSDGGHGLKMCLGSHPHILLLGSLCALNWVILRRSQNRFALNGCVERRGKGSHWLGALGWLSLSFGTEAALDPEAVHRYSSCFKVFDMTEKVNPDKAGQREWTGLCRKFPRAQL